MNEDKKNISVDCTDSSYDKITVAVVAIIFFTFVFLCWFKPQTEVSTVERRKLAKSPDISWDNVISGKFMEDFEKYAVDQIPFRQWFRNFKAVYGTCVLNQADNNGLVITDGYIADMEYELNIESVEYAAGRFKYVYDKYLADTDSRVYFSVIPDKNYYNNKEYTLKYDYNYMVSKMCEIMDFAEYIDVFDELSMEDFYMTDTHWRQEKIYPVAKKLGYSMGADIENDYEAIKTDGKFYGVYYGQMALPHEGDDIYYLTNDIIKNCRVYDYENDREISMYDMDAVMTADPYEMYLFGPLSLVTIDNPDADTDKELIIFRDSFGSSIAPMLATGYSKVTLVDIRYISPEYLGRFVEFDNQDVLFLYNTAVLNNSETIK